MFSPRSGRRLARGPTACQRCRRRKQKCDLKHPRCSNCEGAQAECLTYDLEKQTEIPRNYVSRLEAHIQQLQQELEDLRSQTSSSRIEVETISSSSQQASSSPVDLGASAGRNSSHLQDLVTSVTSASADQSTQPRFLGNSSGITLAKLVMGMIHVDGQPSAVLAKSGGQTSTSLTSSKQSTKSSLPPRQAADHLVDVYFQYRTPHLPLIDRQQVERVLESTYSWAAGTEQLTRAIERDIFTTYMVLAIALCDLPNPQNPSSRGRPSESEGCFLSAITWSEKVIAYSESDIETLRAILLLAQFVALNPSRGSLWHLTGTALRFCIDIGLHWENEDHSLNMDPGALQERRRLWYSTYQFDRVMSITLGRPLGVIDENVRVPIPNPWTRSSQISRQSNDLDIHNQRAHNHMFRMSMLESEIKHVQNNQLWAPKLASPRVNYSAWLQDIQPRLQEWYDTIPSCGKAHPSSIFALEAFWDSLFNNALLLLYRPNSLQRHDSAEALSITFEASCKLIADIRILQREGKCESLWKTIHHLFMAGLGVIYGLWQSKEIRDRNPVSTSISTLQSCASTLSAMTETFPAASSCRDVFDNLFHATVDFLVNPNAENAGTDGIAFDARVGTLLRKLQSSTQGEASTNVNEIHNLNLSDMLSADGFTFSEMLNSAAQWPQFSDMDFNGTDNVVATPTGLYSFV